MLGLTLACSEAATQQSAPPAHPPAPSSAPEPAPDAEDLEAQKVVDAALLRIANLRQLQPKGPVRARHLTVPELVNEVERSLDQHVPPLAVTATSELLFALGAVPADFDYRASLLALMGTELAGLYDPERQLMLLRGDLAEDALEATLLHELVHALQDQHYGLQRVLEWRVDATDELSSLSALAEGDATSAMLDALLEPTGQKAYDLPFDIVEGQMRLMAGGSHDNAQVPEILKRSMIAPYIDGLRFVNAVRQREGWAGVDRIWARPPVTTEQLLHWEKYASAEPARSVPVPPPPPSTSTEGLPWEPLLHDVWGEQSLRLLFEEWMPARSATQAATGWGGDRIVVYGVPSLGLHAVAWHVAADSVEEAQRMHVAFVRGVLSPGWSAEVRYAADVSEEEARKRAAQGAVCREREVGGPFLARRQNASVVVIGGMYQRGAGTGSPVRSAGNCEQAAAWATAILRAHFSPSAPTSGTPSK